MDNQRVIVLKKGETESVLVMNDGVDLKQDPPEQDSVETYHNVYDSLFHVVKHELCENSSEMEHISHDSVCKKPEAGLSTGSSTFDNAGFATDDENNTRSVKIEPCDPDDKCEQVFEIEIAGVAVIPSYYNYDTKDETYINTQSNSSSEPNCDAVIKSETTALEQEESWALTYTTKHELPPSEISASVSCNTNTTLENEDCDGGSDNIVAMDVKRKQKSMKRNKSHATGDENICNLCPYKSRFRSALIVHMRTHTGERPFACELCPYTCTNNSALVCHIRTHTGEKPFECTFCQNKFFRKSHLKDHMKIHTGEKPFNCELCPYKCVKNSTLTTHMRTHTGEAPYVCSVCNKQFKRNRNLIDHMRTHSGERPYACTLCDNKFRQSNHLLVHMRSHTGERPYSCEFCDYRCSVISYLKTHIRTHTGEKPFACSICDYKSARKSSLVHHMTTHTV